MTEADTLASIYLQRHLQEAATVLEDCDPEAIAEFAATLPEDNTIDLLSTLSADTSADCLEHMNDDDAVIILSAMARRKSAAILRLLSPERRNALLQKISAPTRIQLEVILLQPMHRVGAWMESEPLALLQDSTIEAAQRRLKRHTSALSEFYVVDGDRHLVGVVPLSRLLAASDNASVATVAQVPKGTLRANASVDSALDHPAWHDVDTLPVVDKENKLVGSIRHAALRAAAAQPRQSESTEGSGDYVLLANNLYVGLAEVLATSISKPQGEAPLQTEGGIPR